MKKIIIGLDIGGTNTEIGFVSEDGKILLEKTIETRATESADLFIERLFKEINKLKTDDLDIIGIGAAAPCANYFTGMIEDPSNFNWGYVDFVGLIKQQIDVPVVVVNDANAAAIGEQKFGSAQGMKNFVMLTLGTGLGSGIYVNGELCFGAHGLAGELGHMTVDPNGRKCSCGRSGCLETYISASGLKRTVAYLISRYNDQSKLRDIKFNEITGEMISRLAEEGDKMALKTFDYTAEILGAALANIVKSFDPEAIILFGGIANSGDLLLQPTRKYFNENLLDIYKNKVSVIGSELQDGRAAILGVSSLVLENYSSVIQG